jgi:hypothetical protein
VNMPEQEAGGNMSAITNQEEDVENENQQTN